MPVLERWGGPVVFAVAACCYGNALSGGWQVDDPRSFAGNRDVVGQLRMPGESGNNQRLCRVSICSACSLFSPRRRLALPPPRAGFNLVTPGVKGDPYLPSSGLGSGRSLPEGAVMELGPVSQLLADDFWGEPMVCCCATLALWSASLKREGCRRQAQTPTSRTGH